MGKIAGPYWLILRVILHKKYIKAQKQPELDYDVTLGQQTQKFIFWNRLWEYEFLSLLADFF